MILPTSELYVLILLIVSTLAWAIWPSLFKVSARWRFELFEYDLAWGLLIIAVVAAFTLGSANSKELTFQDNFLLTGYRNLAWALGAGVTLCFLTLMLMGAVTISGMSVAFPLTFAVSWSMLSVWNFFAGSQISAMFTFGGSAVLLVAGVLVVIAQSWYLSTLANETAAVLHADPRLTPTKSTAPNSGLGAILAVIAGLAAGVFFHAVSDAGANDNGLSPYGMLLLIAAGFLAGAIVIIPFFLYFPVKGASLQVRHYFKGTMRHHVLGGMAGILLGGAILAGRLAASAPLAIQGAPLQNYLAGHAVPIVAVLIGMVVWREFTDANTRVKAMLAAGMVLLAGGMAVIALAPVYGK